MKLKDLHEMTMRVGDLHKFAQGFVDLHSDEWKTGEHVGDIDQFKVLKTGDSYSVWLDDQIVGHATLTTDSVIDQVWVSADHRGQKIFSKLLWFFKTRLGHPKLFLGDVHSSDMQEVVKGLSRFDKFWVKDNQVEPFSLDTLDKFYYAGKPTGWILMLENDGDFSGWPRFTQHKDFIRESYDWQIE